MITWSPTAEPFCRYARRRRAARRWMIADAYQRAADPTSRKLADRLAEPWRGVLRLTLAEAGHGDAEALKWLQVCAPDRVENLRTSGSLRKTAKTG